ncbi:MAG: hypothetical protein QXK47_02435 [Candidatus Bathyarchaeia archaeon]
MLRVEKHIRRETVCLACHQKIPKGSPAAAKYPKCGFRYFCLECYRRMMKGDVFVYQPQPRLPRRYSYTLKPKEVNEGE